MNLPFKVFLLGFLVFSVKAAKSNGNPGKINKTDNNQTTVKEEDSAVNPETTTQEAVISSTEAERRRLNGNFTSGMVDIQETSTGNGVVVKVGHIGAVNVMPKAEKILEMCKNELRKEGILDNDFDIE